MKKIFLSICTLLLLATSAMAQVTVSLTLRPPYSANIRDYYHLENKAIIVLTNTSRTAMEVKLGGSISNEERGVYIRTEPAYRPSTPIRLAAGATVTLTANADAMNFFDQNNVTTNANDAMIANIIRTGMLPEGTYTLCINAYDYSTGRQVSNNDAGCFSFDLSQAGPPVITFPQNDYVYSPDQAAKTFSWTPPMGNLAGSLIEYDQVVVKVQPGQNPNDAITAARDFNAGNPVIYKKNLLTQTYITQPYDLPFDNESMYAMQVVARDRNGKLLLGNNGQSEVVTFRIGQPTSTIRLDGPTHGSVADADIPEYYAMQNVTGSIKYYWPIASENNNSVNGMGIQGSSYAGMINSPLKGVRVRLILTWQILDEENDAGLGFLLRDGLVPPTSAISGYQGQHVKYRNDYTAKTLATTTTDASGNFSFNVVNAGNIDFSVKYGAIDVQGLGNSTNEDINTNLPLPSRFSGQMRRALAVVVDDVHYAHPIQFKTSFPQNGNLGTFYSRVKNMNAKVRVQDKYDHSAKSGIEIWLLRKAGQRPAGVPMDELKPGNFSTNDIKVIGGQSYEVLAKKEADTQGEATFQNLVFFNYYSQYDNNSNPYDRYYAYAEQEETNFSLKQVIPVDMVFDFDGHINVLSNTPDFSTDEIASFNKTQSIQNYSLEDATMQIGSNPYYYTIPPTLYTAVNTEKDKPRLITKVRNEAAGIMNTTLNRAEPKVHYYLYKINRSGMQQAKNSINDHWGGTIENGGEDALSTLQNILGGSKMKFETHGVTGDDGKIDARNLDNQWSGTEQVGYYRFLKVKKAGFGTRVFRAKSAPVDTISGDMQYIGHGETYQMNDIEIRPLGSLFVKLVNERGDPVAGQAYYHDPVSGQNGTTKGSMWMAESNGEYAQIIPNMNVPTGQISIVVQPTANSLYVRDTFVVNVPENQQHSVTLQVKYKLHRIYFNVWSDATGPARPIKGAKVALMEMSEGSAIMYDDLHSPYINDGVNVGGLQTGPLRGTANPVIGSSDGNGVQAQPVNGMPPTALGPYEKLSNNGGGVDFAFRNAGTDEFKFRITGPSGEISYVTIERNVSNAAGKRWQAEYVELKAGRKVTGTVKLGQMPVAGATVQVLDRRPVIQATTDAEGRYELNGVPAGVNLRFSASKQGSDYVGMEYDEAHPETDSGYGLAEYTLGSQTVHLPGQPDYIQPVSHINFKLRIYENLDLSKLLGFPLEVTDLKENPAGMQIATNRGGVESGNAPKAAKVAVEISGFIHIPDSLNNVFKLDATNTDGEALRTVRFEHRLVVADDVKNEVNLPYCRPQVLPMRTDVTEQHIEVFDRYNASMRDNQGIGINKLGSGSNAQGVVESKVSIELTSFTDNNIGLPAGQLFYLANQNGNQTSTTFPVFTSSGEAVISTDEGVGLSDATGDAIGYTLHELDARAAALTSRLYVDSMVLDTRLQTNLQHVDNPNLDLPIGKVVINQDRELDDIDKDIATSTSMGSFSIDWNHIKISSSQGGVLLNGVINAAGMNLPFSNAALYPTRFEVPDGSLDPDNIQLLDHIDVQVNAPASFGYEAARNAWVVAIYEAGRSFQNPAAAFSTAQLQGFAANRSIPISSIYLYSDDTRDINLYNEGNYTYRLYDIVDFYIDNILPAQGILKMPGTLNLGIPAFPNYNTAVQYDKVPDGISGLSFQQFDMHPVTVNGVVMGFNPGNNTQSGNNTAIDLSAGRLVVKGTVSDENPDVFNNLRSTITKTNQLTELVIDEPESGRQQMALGGANTGSRMILSEIAGKMWVVDNSWNHLYIDGDMPEAMGFKADGKRMRFEVLGALKVENQAVKLENISTPFGDINLVYDMANHRLSGNLQVGADAGGASFSGAINMVIDRSGYYFMSGMSVAIPSPSMQGMGFLLIGDYGARTVEMDAMLSSYSMFIQKKLQIMKPEMANAALNLLQQNPEAGISMVQSVLGNDYLPSAYTGLFSGGPFNGFYFNAGVDIPIPVIPSFEVNLGVANFGISVNMGADVRFGANFGSTNTYSAGLSVFLNAYIGGGVNAGLFCIYGRVGAMVSLSLNGFYRSDGYYKIDADGNLLLSGNLTAGAMLCLNKTCDDDLCVHGTLNGSLSLGMRGSFTPSGTDYELYITSNNLSEPEVHTPPPPPPAGEQ